MPRRLLTALLAAAALLAPAGAAHAVSTDIVISEVYGGGGNSGATLTNDFIELYNRGAAPIDVNGWAVQYASATGSSWQRTALSGTIQPGARHLVQEGQGAGGTQALPAPDDTGAIAMSATSGKVALTTNAIACAGIDCAGAARRDFVGYGGANASETAPAPGLSNTTSASRNGGGATDTDNNAGDFTAGEPSPRNSSGEGGGGDEEEEPPGEPARIHDIQGAAHLTTFAGDLVEVPGVVTAVSGNGFWIQDPQPDDDRRSSEGIFVFRGTGAAVGDSVRVTGTVSEFRPGNDADNLTLTEVTARDVVVEGSGASIAPTLLGPGGLTPPLQVIEDDANGNVETSGEFDPAEDGIDFHESLEGMLVRIAQPRAVGPTSGFGEIPVVAGDAATPFTARGGVFVRPIDFNPERLIVDDVIADTPAVNVGDRLSEPLDAVVDYSFGNFKYLVTAAPQRIDNGLLREVTEAPRANQLAMASMNVENLDPTDPPAKFATLAEILVTNLRSPDIVAVEEIQDNNGAAQGDSDATLTYQRFIAAIAAAGGPSYDFRQINPVPNQDGGEPGGNIRVGFLFRTDRGLEFVDRPGGTATNSTGVVAIRNGAQLTFSPGRIDPTNPAFANSRKPLAGEFRWRGRTVFAIANHFNSKGGDQPLFGRFQPPERSSEVQRHQQAQVVRGFVEDVLEADPRAAIAVLGDLNDFEFSRTLEILEGGGLANLMETLPAAERYSYVFEGNSQVLDQILVSRELLTPKPEYDSVHVNAEFADQASDHDPQVARVVVRGTGNSGGG